MSPAAEKRCSAGQPDEPTDCERHPKHYWCRWCEGWYGIPHFDMCHTAGIRRGGKHPRLSHQCACRFCATAEKFGYDFTVRTLRAAPAPPVPPP